MNWVVGSYGGVVDPAKLATSSNGLNASASYQTVNNILFSIIDPAWLPSSVSTGGFDQLLYNTIIKNVLDLNLSGILGILVKNGASNEGLNQTTVKVLLGVIFNVLDLILPGTVTAHHRATYTSLDSLLSVGQNNLQALVGNLIWALGKGGDRIVASALPLVSDLMGASRSQGYREPTIEIPSMQVHRGAFGEAAAQQYFQFQLANDSGGLPAVNYNYAKAKKSEKAYSFKLVSASVKHSNGSSVTTLAGTPVVLVQSNGSTAQIANHIVRPGEVADLRVDYSGNKIPANSVAIITLTYDIIRGTGANDSAMSQGIETRLYTYLAGTENYKSHYVNNIAEYEYYDSATSKKDITDDTEGVILYTGGDEETARSTPEKGFANRVVVPEALYFTQNSTLQDLADGISIQIARDADFDREAIPASGSNPAIPAHTAVHTEAAKVIWDPYEQENPGEQDTFPYDNPTLAEFLTQNFEAVATTDSSGSGATIRPFKLKEGVDPNEKVIGYKVDEEGNATGESSGFGPGAQGTGEQDHDLIFYLLGQGTVKNGTSGTPGGYDQQSYQESFMMNGIKIVFENTYGLPELFNAVRANDPQKRDYGSAGASLFDGYMDLTAKAAYYAMKPKDSNYANPSKATIAKDLVGTKQTLDEIAASLSGGTGTNDRVGVLKNLLSLVLGDNDRVDDDPSDDLRYYEEGYRFFDAMDFVPMGYKKAVSAIAMAQDLIRRESTGENPPSALEIAYAESSLKETCAMFIDEVTENNLDDRVAEWWLVYKVAYHAPMARQLQDAEKWTFGTKKVTLAALRTAYETQQSLDPYYDGNYTVSEETFDGGTVRTLMNAWFFADGIRTEFSEESDFDLADAGYLGALGEGEDASVEVSADAWTTYGALKVYGGYTFTPQSKLTRARDELVLALKSVRLASEDTEPDPDPDKPSYNWDAITDALNAAASQSAAIVQYKDFFVQTYAQAYTTAYVAATDLLGQRDTLEASGQTYDAQTQASINAAGNKLLEVLDYMVAIVPQAGAYVYTGSGIPSMITVDMAKYNAEALAYSTQTDGGFLETALLAGEESVTPVLSDGTGNDAPYDGFIYGLDVSKPSFAAAAGKNAPYQVINGTAEIVPNASGKSNTTGATVNVKNNKGEVIYVLKAVYFGDVNGNGTVLESSEQTDAKMVAAGQKWDENVEFSPKVMALDVKADGVIENGDVAVFKSGGLKYVSQSYASVLGADDNTLVTPGKPAAPQTGG
jgi:hypothetical protein